MHFHHLSLCVNSFLMHPIRITDVLNSSAVLCCSGEFQVTCFAKAVVALVRRKFFPPYLIHETGLRCYLNIKDWLLSHWNLFQNYSRLVSCCFS